MAYILTFTYDKACRPQKKPTLVTKQAQRYILTHLNNFTFFFYFSFFFLSLFFFPLSFFLIFFNIFICLQNGLHVEACWPTAVFTPPEIAQCMRLVVASSVWSHHYIKVTTRGRLCQSGFITGPQHSARSGVKTWWHSQSRPLTESCTLSLSLSLSPLSVCLSLSPLFLLVIPSNITTGEIV